MAFSVVDLKLEGVKLIKSDVYSDERGFFRETFKLKDFINLGLPTHFPQENCSFSNVGVARGIHYQVPHFAQGKLVSCLFGKIIDFAVDLRFQSYSFLQYVEVEISSENGNLLFIPEGFGHAFIALKPSIVYYKATNPYSPEHERYINLYDPEIGLHLKEKYGDSDFIISEKDKNAPMWKTTEVF